MPPSPTAICEISGFRDVTKPSRTPAARLISSKFLGAFNRLSYAPGSCEYPGQALPKLSLPVRLALLVAGTTLPLILFAAGIVYNNYEQDRQDATQRVSETVRSIRLVLDSEMQRMTGALQVLALTDTLRSGDFIGFRRIAQGFLDQYGEGGVVLVADREGRQVFSSLTMDM